MENKAWEIINLVHHVLGRQIRLFDAEEDLLLKSDIPMTRDRLAALCNCCKRELLKCREQTLDFINKGEKNGEQHISNGE